MNKKIKKLLKIFINLFLVCYLLLYLFSFFIGKIYYTRYFSYYYNIINNNNESITLTINNNISEIKIKNNEEYTFNDFEAWGGDNVIPKNIKNFQLFLKGNEIFNFDKYNIYHRNSYNFPYIEILEKVDKKEKITYFPIYIKRKYFEINLDITIR